MSDQECSNTYEDPCQCLPDPAGAPLPNHKRTIGKVLLFLSFMALLCNAGFDFAQWATMRYLEPRVATRMVMEGQMAGYSNPYVKVNACAEISDAGVACDITAGTTKEKAVRFLFPIAGDDLKELLAQ